MPLVAGRGEHWRSVRAAWQPAFYSGSLQKYTALMNDKANRLCACLEEHAKRGDAAEVWRLFGAMTMEIVGTTAFGLSCSVPVPCTPAETIMRGLLVHRKMRLAARYVCGMRRPAPGTRCQPHNGGTLAQGGSQDPECTGRPAS